MLATMSLKQAIKAIKAGDKATGKQLLARVLKTDPHNEYAWLWMTEVVDSKKESLMCLRNVLKINPNHDIAKRKIAELEQEVPEREQTEQVAQVEEKESEEPVSEEPISDSAISLQIPQGKLVIDHEREQIILNDEPSRISPIELDVLMALVRRQGELVTYQTLLADVWEITEETPAAHVSTQDIEKYIYFLRRRLEEDPANPTLIQHEEGKGYRLG